MANVSRYVFRIELRNTTTDQWSLVREYTADGKPLFTIKLAGGYYRVAVKTPCMATWSAAFEFGVP